MEENPFYARKVVVDRFLEEQENRRMVKLRPAGNALAITIPQKWIRELGWKAGDYVILDKVLDKIILDRSRAAALYLQEHAAPAAPP